MKRKKIIVVGAGIGGLAVANLLAKAGHDVTVYEKEATPGGRAGKMVLQGFTFDTGPSWYLMPDVFDHYYGLLGESVEQWLDLQRLSPAYKAFFETTPPITITGTLETDARTFDTIEAGAGTSLKKYVEHSDEIYQLSLRHFLYSNFENITDFLHPGIIKKSVLLPKLLLKPIHHYVSGFVHDRRLKQILEYPMVFLGTSPFTAPSMYSLMSALDFKEGVFYPQGGMYTIIESLTKIGSQLGVTYKYDTHVEKIITKNSNVQGIRLSNQDEHLADIVISNADLHFTETKLLDAKDQSFSEAYWSQKEAGPSALLVYLGINKRIPEYEHHNLLLVDEWEKNFAAIYDTKTIPGKASIYISKTSHTDSSVAPEGSENLFILVPLPSGISLSSQQLNALTDHYLTQIETMTNVSLKEHIVVKSTFGPDEFKTKFYSWQSSMLGQSHLLRQSAFFRTPNKSKKVQNLYYVGASTTPGIGLPMCLIGAELVFKRIIGDKKGGKVTTIEKVDRL